MPGNVDVGGNDLHVQISADSLVAKPPVDPEYPTAFRFDDTKVPSLITLTYKDPKSGDYKEVVIPFANGSLVRVAWR
jgi:hypothetical protein